MGKKGNDLAFGGLGDNAFFGGDGFDTLIAGPGADTLSGGSGNDSNVGLGGNDNLAGNKGNDTLSGGIGDDTLTGNSGNDTFTFESSEGGLDTIADFFSDEDTIQVSGNGFGTDLRLGTLADNKFSLGSSANDSSDRFIYNRDSAALFFDSDGTGSAAQIQLATLSNDAGLDHSDISIV